VTGYYALDDDAWYILAGRITAGSIVGATVEDIPPSHLFFAGGGGSVRGYQYRSLPTTTLVFRSAAAACWKAPPKRA
jgi:translocation and assembly module TamA